MGALLVTGAATGAFLVATSAEAASPTTDVLVVRVAIEAGAPVGGGDVVAEPMSLPDPVAGRVLTSTVGLEGAVALRDLHPGELLSADDLLASPEVDGRPVGAIHELTIPAPADRSPRVLRRGDRVTILSLVRGDEPRTVVALEDVVVLAFEATEEGFGRDTVSLTLAVDDPADVVELAHLARAGELTVVRSTRAIAEPYPAARPTVPPAISVPGEDTP